MSQPSFYQPQRISGLISRLVPSGGTVGITNNGVISTSVMNVAVLPSSKTLQVVQVTALPQITTASAATPSTSSFASVFDTPPTAASAAAAVTRGQEVAAQDPIDLQIRNVVCMFSVCCHVDLRLLAMNSCHVMYERAKGVSTKRRRVTSHL
ncbi:unnamed protein product [Soboliphyme baturini]|uniref:Transcription initiation factor TFIID subunit 4 n=1 Tax=Soboliphyme baturini TaxID=241478 RepID=A0A183IX46_9BILA|nr:unnamed protein product [Soboliphyme baturini]